MCMEMLALPLYQSCFLPFHKLSFLNQVLATVLFALIKPLPNPLSCNLESVGIEFALIWNVHSIFPVPDIEPKPLRALGMGSESDVLLAACLQVLFWRKALMRLLDRTHNHPASTAPAMVITGLNHQAWCKTFLPATLWLTNGMENAEFNTNAFQSDSVRTPDPKLWSKLAEKSEYKQGYWSPAEFGSMFEEQFPMSLPAQKNALCEEAKWEASGLCVR